MNEKKVVWMSAFRYVVPTDFENWMEQMARQGWNVESIGQWSSVRMAFFKTEPKLYRYVYDINVTPSREYLSIYEQLGWEYVGMMASCFIWRRPYTDQRPESFTDLESLRTRNLRVVRAVSVSFGIFLAGFLAASIGFGILLPILKPGDIAQFILGIALTLGLSVYLGCVMLQIYRNRLR